MVFTCILCGISNYEDMEEFCDINEAWFRKWITLPNGIPSYNTFSSKKVIRPHFHRVGMLVHGSLWLISSFKIKKLLRCS